MITIEEMLECHPEASRGELRDGSGTVRYCFEVIRFLLFGSMANRRLAGRRIFMNAYRFFLCSPSLSVPSRLLGRRYLTQDPDLRQKAVLKKCPRSTSITGMASLCLRPRLSLLSGTVLKTAAPKTLGKPGLLTSKRPVWIIAAAVR